MVTKALGPLNLTSEQETKAVEGFRQFLYSAGVTGGKSVMPSKVVDELWHTFITYTHEYQKFCLNTFGYYLHHKPEETMDAGEQQALHTTRLLGTWAAVTAISVVAVPELFDIDQEVGVEHATTYTLDPDIAGGEHLVNITTLQAQHDPRAAAGSSDGGDATPAVLAAHTTSDPGSSSDSSGCSSCSSCGGCG